VDLFLPAFFFFGLPTWIVIAIWRSVAVAAYHDGKKGRPGPLGPLIIGALLLPASPSFFLIALERSDWLDYPDGGSVGLWALAGLASLLGAVVCIVNGASQPRIDPGHKPD
jgi:hypothetical protein